MSLLLLFGKVTVSSGSGAVGQPDRIKVWEFVNPIKHEPVLDKLAMYPKKISGKAKTLSISSSAGSAIVINPRPKPILKKRIIGSVISSQNVGVSHVDAIQKIKISGSASTLNGSQRSHIVAEVESEMVRIVSQNMYMLIGFDDA